MRAGGRTRHRTARAPACGRPACSARSDARARGSLVLARAAPSAARRPLAPARPRSHWPPCARAAGRRRRGAG
eukprot:2226097-Prymnesium_polylepis.1